MKFYWYGKPAVTRINPRQGAHYVPTTDPGSEFRSDRQMLPSVGSPVGQQVNLMASEGNQWWTQGEGDQRE